MRVKTGLRTLLFLLLLLMVNIVSDVYAAEGSPNGKFSSTLRLKSTFSKIQSETILKPLVAERSNKGVKLVNKPGFLSARKSSLSNESSSIKSEKPVYIRYLLPVAITIGAGTATYMLYSVRSN